MCGIAGISVAAGDTILNTRVLASELLLQIESRGRDATGAAWFTAEGETVDLTKVPVPATRFVHHRKDHMPESTPVMILHTRTGTHGSSTNRLNLHPVVHERIVGVHNGVLRNHPDLFKKAGRKPTAEVDSEGLMAILNTDRHPTDVLGQIRGDAALAWIDLDEPEVLHLACVTGRPLHIASTKEGSLIFASTQKAIREAATVATVELVFEQEVKEETYMRVVGGIIVETRKITGVQHSDKAFKQKYAYTSGPGAAKAPGKPQAAATAPKPSTPRALPAAPANSRYEADVAAARAASARIPQFTAPIL